jgi:hypothetical protein
MYRLLKEVRREKIFEDIVRQIRGLIKKGRLKVGDKLPPERDLAGAFRVSRASVREAFCGKLGKTPGNGCSWRQGKPDGNLCGAKDV